MTAVATNQQLSSVQLPHLPISYRSSNMRESRGSGSVPKGMMTSFASKVASSSTGNAAPPTHEQPYIKANPLVSLQQDI